MRSVALQAGSEAQEDAPPAGYQMDEDAHQVTSATTAGPAQASGTFPESDAEQVLAHLTF